MKKALIQIDGRWFERRELRKYAVLYAFAKPPSTNKNNTNSEIKVQPALIASHSTPRAVAIQ